MLFYHDPNRFTEARCQHYISARDFSHKRDIAYTFRLRLGVDGDMHTQVTVTYKHTGRLELAD